MTPLLSARIPPGAEAAVASVLRSGYVGGNSPVVAEFERALAAKLACDPECLVSTNSGTSALLLAMELANVRDGLAVTTPMTFVATTTAIYQAGGEPSWADCQPGTCLIDQGRIARHLSFWTGRPGPFAAVVAVAWGGFLPARLGEIERVARRRRIPLILDAAQAFGVEVHGGADGPWPAHRIADFTIYSFAPTKHLTTGDGGALICRSREDADRARRLAWFGMRRNVIPPERWPSDQNIPEAGFKLHMNAIAAALGLAGLEDIDATLAACRRNAATYHAKLGGNVTLAGASPWTWTVFVENPSDFVAYMESHGVQAGQPHRRNDDNGFASAARRNLPGVDFAQAHYCCIPVGWWVDEREADRIAGLVAGYPGLLRDG